MRMNDADTRWVSTSAGYVGMDTETTHFGIHAAHLKRGVLAAQGNFCNRTLQKLEAVRDGFKPRRGPRLNNVKYEVTYLSGLRKTVDTD